MTRKGRIDLDVVAVTGQIGPNVRALKLLGINLPALGPLPISLVMSVSDLLSNRMIRIRITGTVKSPNVQINKAALLTDTAVRFFLGQYVLPDSLQNTPLIVFWHWTCLDFESLLFFQMESMMLRLVMLSGLLLSLCLGCEQKTTIVTVPATKKEVDIHIQGPNLKIDVEKKKDGKVEVDVKKKNPG